MRRPARPLLGNGFKLTARGDVPLRRNMAFGRLLDAMDPNIILDIDCDFETSYARMIDAIISRAADAVCDAFTHVPRREGAGVP